MLIECLSERSKLRNDWKDRYNDPVFESIPADERPLKCPCLDNNIVDLNECITSGQVPESLDNLIEQLRQWRSEFVSEPDDLSTKMLEQKTAEPKAKKRKKKKTGSLTRKEQMRAASNWEMLKKKL